jgi:hypothetical protein
MTGQIVRLDGRTLATYQRGDVVGPQVTRDHWSAEDIAVAMSAVGSTGSRDVA